MPPKKAVKLAGYHVVVVDCGVNMKERYDDHRTHFDVGIEAAEWFISRKLFSGDTDNYTIMGYGSTEKSNVDGYDKGLQLYSDTFSKPSFEHLKFIREDLKQSDAVGRVFKALSGVADIVRQVEEKDYDSSTIVLITNGFNENLKNEEIELLEAALRGFNIIAIGPDSNSSTGSSRITELVEQLDGIVKQWDYVDEAMKFYPAPIKGTRNLNKNWEIAPNVTLPLKFAVKSQKAPNHIKFVPKKRPEAVWTGHSIEEKMEEEEEDVKEDSIKTGVAAKNLDNEFVEDDEKEDIVIAKLQKVFNFGTSLITFDQEEIEDKYNNHNFNEKETGGCLKLIQFTRKSNIMPSYLYEDTSYTVVPVTKGKDTSGIECAISLLESMIANDVVAINRYAFHASSHLSLVALIPHRDESGTPYFRALKLPFANDVRSLKFPKLDAPLNGDDTTPTVAQLSAIDDFIDGMQLDNEDREKYTKGGISDPKYMVQCEYIKNKALNPEDTEKCHEDAVKREMDTLMKPYHKSIANQNDNIGEKLKEMFNLQRVIKNKRGKVELETVDLAALLQDWETQATNDQEEEKKSKKKNKNGKTGGGSKSKREEIEELFAEDATTAAGKVCENSINTIKTMCNFPECATRFNFFEVIVSELSTLREFCVEHQKCTEFNQCMETIRSTEDYQPFAEHLGEVKLCYPISDDEVSSSGITKEDSEAYWDDV